MLPVEAVFTEIHQAINAHPSVILQAPPGAGKSTWLPLALLAQGKWHGKLILLEPRRVAARNIAHYLSQQLDEKIGQTIGLRMRGETRVSSQTKLEVVTEGVLTRILQSDPELSDYHLVLFDEFHERSLQSDLAFVLAKQVQAALRDDLKLLIMSATLDLASLNRTLPDAPVIKSEGRNFPIEVFYRPYKTNNNDWFGFENHIIKVIKESLVNSGDILVFLAGSGEINRLEKQLKQTELNKFAIHTLHGQLSLKQQQQALQADQQGKRKIVLATNIAETSLTIENVSIVIDTGLHKKVKYDNVSEFSQLITEQISQDSAVQRMGRAGRTHAGICYRLWPEESQSRLRKHYPAEIEQADLSQLCFEVYLWGETNVLDLDWPTPPSDNQIRLANEKLARLKLIDLSPSQQKITELGLQLQAKGADLIAGIILNVKPDLALAHLFAAWLQENRQVNTWQLNQSLVELCKSNNPIKQAAEKSLQREISAASIEQQFDDLYQVIVPLFIHRVAKKLGNQNDKVSYLMACGSAVDLYAADSLNPPEWILVIDASMSNKSPNATIRSAFELDWQMLEAIIQPYLQKRTQVDYQANQLSFYQQTSLLKLPLNKVKLSQAPSQQEKTQAWLALINKQGIELFNHADAIKLFIYRWNLAAEVNSDFASISFSYLIETAETWLSLYLADINSVKQLANLDIAALWLQQKDYALQQTLASLLPTKYEMPDGRVVKIDYSHESGPKLSCFMQSFYGLTEHPSIANGRVKLTCELLSPAKRPIQTTQDLINFWSGSYDIVKKEMKGRYPKHYWPDDPLVAEAGTKTKRQRSQTNDN
ncbi:ATP-dependent helicase HrpB [Catenovulum maritimum]|uniref:ATP-dependent helicase HrpB n=1 Tax=Catenovulum maritimum TaxID=1513271 RepID=UPI001C11D0D8|nr:ATP-dependent helicase HrpB [Catenovulum maritimum]